MKMTIHENNWTILIEDDIRNLTKDEILEYYNEHRFNSVDGKEMYPQLKTLKAVQYYCGVKIYNIKPIK